MRGRMSSERIMAWIMCAAAIVFAAILAACAA